MLVDEFYIELYEDLLVLCEEESFDQNVADSSGNNQPMNDIQLFPKLYRLALSLTQSSEIYGNSLRA
ncbi:unnamed protein product [Dracunculus medinensis]|uniref:Uncharacterized protein n=1 Tax=Dracunculus medinensis TaxID=318479 RepID=A0A0N4U2N3_DRAME|nr:unnamed protein product [Dracunculus medinensis]